MVFVLLSQTPPERLAATRNSGLHHSFVPAWSLVIDGFHSCILCKTIESLRQHFFEIHLIHRDLDRSQRVNALPLSIGGSELHQRTSLVRLHWDKRQSVTILDPQLLLGKSHHIAATPPSSPIFHNGETVQNKFSAYVHPS